MPVPCPTIITKSFLETAYTKSVIPPSKLKYQNGSGITLSRFFSLTTHCMRNLALNKPWPTKPIIRRIASLVFIPLGKNQSKKNSIYYYSSLIKFLGYRRINHMTPSRSIIPEKSRSRLAYLETPWERCR